MILLTGWVDVDPQRRDAALAAGCPHMRATRAWPGCLDYVWSADPLNPARIYVYERWESEAALASHFQGPHYRAMRDATASTTCAEVAATTPAAWIGTAAFHDARSNGNRRASHRMPGVSAAHEYQ